MRWRVLVAAVIVMMVAVTAFVVRPPAPASAVGRARIIDSSIRTPDGRHRTYRAYVPANLPAPMPTPFG